MTQAAAPRVLIISHDAVGSRMAGPGIRAWNMARVLAARWPVTLVAPRPIDLRPADFRCGEYAWGDAASLAGWLREADVVVANGFALEAHPELAGIAQPLALDIYDPVLLENLELLRGAPAEQRAERAARDRALLDRQLAAGDFFLCATERQRDLYLGALILAGRLTPALADADPRARGLVDVAPFGLPAEPPVHQAPALRGVLPGVGADDPLLLWTGGLWDWLDPLTLIDALPTVAERYPSVRLVFLAGRHPGTAAEMRMPDRARARADSLGLLGRNVLFYDEWVPYARRADFLLEATLAVSLHRDHLETAYAAVRSRFLDHLWAGLPSVVSAGDAAAELVERHDLGLAVPPGDAAATAAALIAALEDEARLARWAANARALAGRFTWERALAPLVGWVETAGSAPAHTRERTTMTEQAPSPGPAEQPAPDFAGLAELIRQAEALWEIGRAAGAESRSRPKDVLRAAVQAAAAPVYDQQTRFNAAIVRALYWLMTEAQRAESRAESRADAQQARLWALERQLADTRALLRQALPELNDRLAEGERDITLLAQELGKLLSAAPPAPSPHGEEGE